MIGEFIGNVCITPIICMILGLPIALYLHYKRGYKSVRALGYGGLIVFGLVILVGVILDLAGAINLGQVTSIANGILQPTNMPLPTYTQYPTYTPVSPLVATIASGFGAKFTQPTGWDNNYKEISCNIETPERFTSIRCFNLAVVVPHSLIILPAEGTVYYSGNNITHIQIGYRDRGKEFTSVECAKFVIDVARSAGWNLDDLSNIMSRVVNSKEQEWVTYNTIAAYRDSDTDWWYFNFEQVP